MNAVCRRCRHRHPVTFRAQHFAGGDYRRPSRWYWSTICAPCADELLLAVSPAGSGHRTVDGWSIAALRRGRSAVTS